MFIILGAYVATTCSARALSYVSQFGADEIINYQEKNWFGIEFGPLPLNSITFAASGGRYWRTWTSFTMLLARKTASLTRIFLASSITVLISDHWILIVVDEENYCSLLSLLSFSLSGGSFLSMSSMDAGCNLTNRKPRFELAGKNESIITPKKMRK